MSHHTNCTLSQCYILIHLLNLKIMCHINILPPKSFPAKALLVEISL